jgi:hypothetical protein
LIFRLSPFLSNASSSPRSKSLAELHLMMDSDGGLF